MRYVLSKVDEFWEVFDTVEKITVYVSESKGRAKQQAFLLNGGCLQ